MKNISILILFTALILGASTAMAEPMAMNNEAYSQLNIEEQQLRQSQARLVEIITGKSTGMSGVQNAGRGEVILHQATIADCEKEIRLHENNLKALQESSK